MINTVARKERKFLLSLQEALKQERFIKNALNNDIHNTKNGYIVRSLYFENQDYEDKQAGIEIRKKIRLRNYIPRDEFAVLEMKQKQGDNQLKRSLVIKKEDALELINGKYTNYILF